MEKNKPSIIFPEEFNINSFEYHGFIVHYKGFLYVDGFKSGRDSILEILENMAQTSKFDFCAIKGSYVVSIEHKPTGMRWLFADNSGQMKFYYGQNTISPSFLMVLDNEKPSASDLNPRAINDFLHFGFVYFNETFFKSIQALSKDDFFEIDRHGNRKICKKEIPELHGPVKFNFHDHFKNFALALQSYNNISADLTGGFDSRLIVAMLMYFDVDFEMAVSGRQGIKDIKIPAKIAEILQKPFYITYHDATKLREADLRKIFEMVDSQMDVISYHRNYQFNLDRKKRKVDMQLNGSGGALYKDFWWLQDFPFYKKKKSNIEKLYKYRIEAVEFPHYLLGDQLRTVSQKFKNNTIQKLFDYRLTYNTQTYDNINYNHKTQNASAYITAASRFFNCTAPLLELDLARFGFSQKRSTRFFNNFHKEYITKYYPQISKIKTTERVRCSSHTKDKIFDVFNYLYDKQIRLTMQILRKTLKKTYLQESPTDKRIYNIVRNFPITDDIENILKKYEIISRDTFLKKVKDQYLGRFISLGMLLERMEQNRK